MNDSEHTPPASPAPGGLDRTRDAAALAGLAIFAVLLTCRGFTLPFIHVDEPFFIVSGRKAMDTLLAGNVLEGLRQFTPPSVFVEAKIPNFGPTVFGAAGIWERLVGTAPPLWHLGKTLHFILTLWGMYAIGRVARFPVALSVVGPLLTGLFAPWMGPLDFQAYQGNWVRMFNTDTFHLTFAVWQLACLARVLESPRPERIALAGFGLFGLLSLFTKITALTQAAPMAMLVGLYCLWQRRIPRRVWALTAVMVAVWLMGAVYYNPLALLEKGGGETTRKGFSFAGFLTGVSVYRDMLLDGWGITGGLIFLPGLAPLFGRRTPPFQRMMLWTVLAYGVLAFVVQANWWIYLPRYAITFVPFMALFIGLGVGWVFWFVPSGAATRGGFAAKVAASWSLGWLLWALALWPLLLGPNGPPAGRWWRLAALLAAGVAAAAVWAAASWLTRRSGRAIHRRIALGAGIATMTIVHGQVAWQTMYAVLATNYFFAHYGASARVNGAAVGSVAQWSPREMAGGEKPVLMFTPPNGEVKWQFSHAATLMTGLEPAGARDWDPSTLGQAHYLISYRQDANPQSATYKPINVFRGWRLTSGKPDLPPRGYHGLLLGDTLRFPIGVGQDTALHGIGFFADVLFWDPAVDLVLTVENESGAVRGVQKGTGLPRHRNISQMLFERPLLLQAGKPATVTFALRRADGLPVTESLPGALFRVSAGRSEFNGRPLDLQPDVELLAAVPLPDFELAEVHRAEVRAPVVMSPFMLLARAQISAQARPHDAAVVQESVYEVEIYRNRKLLAPGAAERRWIDQ